MKTKTRFHKLTAWLLTLAMLMTFIPTFSQIGTGLTVYATEGTGSDSDDSELGGGTGDGGSEAGSGGSSGTEGDGTAVSYLAPVYEDGKIKFDENNDVVFETKTVTDYIVAEDIAYGDTITSADKMPTIGTSGETAWYVADSDIEWENFVLVQGDVHLIICDDVTITSSYGIVVSEGNSFTVYGQENGTGTLVAKGMKYSGGFYSAAIGGCDVTTEMANGGTITINGCQITATASSNAAAIGGGNGGHGGNIIINGGTVSANATAYSAAIGGGSRGNSGNITINGGIVSAETSGSSSAIGAGYVMYSSTGGSILAKTDKIEINGGTVVATQTDSYEEYPVIGGLYGFDNINISGGHITVSHARSGGIGIGTNSVTAMEFDGNLNISGGTIISGNDKTLYLGAGKTSSSAKGTVDVVVTGGNISGDVQKFSTLTDGTNNVVKKEFALVGAENKTPVTEIEGYEEYGLTDVVTDYDKLTIYVAENGEPESIKTDEKTYLEAADGVYGVEGEKILSFNANGGTGAMSSISFSGNESKTLSLNEFTRSYYNFTGWNTSPDGNGTSYADGASINITENAVLYAQWEQITYNVTFDPGDGTGTMENDTAYAAASNNYILPECTFTAPEGKLFRGWKVGTSSAILIPGTKITVSSDTTATAVWSDPIVEVTMDGVTTTYPSLEQVIPVVKDKNAEIKVIKDFSLTAIASIYANKLVIDLNGKTISGYIFDFYCNSELKGPGTINVSYQLRLRENFTMTVGENVNIMRTSGTNATSYAVQASNGSTLILNGGSVTCNSTTAPAIYSTGTAVVVNADGVASTFNAPNVYYNVTPTTVPTNNNTSGKIWYRIDNQITNGSVIIADGITTVYDEKIYGLAGQTVTITPKAGYTLADVKVNGNDATESSGNYTFSMPAGVATLTGTASSSHTHNWNYELVGTDTIKATCQTANCPETGAKTIVISAVGKEYDGEAVTATVVNNFDSTDYNASIVYEAKTGSLTDGKAVNVGTYTAKITVSGVTASIDFTIAKADAEIPTDLTSVYGRSLNDITLPDGWTWENPMDSVGNVGEQTHKATYAGDDNHNAASNVELTVTVSQSSASMTAYANKNEYAYGEPVTITVNGITPTGVAAVNLFSLTATTTNQVAIWNGDTQLTESQTVTGEALNFTVEGLGIGECTLTAKFTGNDNMAPTSASVTIVINKAIPNYTTPGELKATYGDTLNDVILPTADNGVWSWASEGDSVGNAGTQSHSAIFTPNDTTNYEVVNVNVSVTVDKAVIGSADFNVTAPEAGAVPQTAVTAGTGYSAEIAWNETAEKFGFNTAYTATITLTADGNHKFADTLSKDGWTVALNNDKTVATFTKTFDATRKQKIESVTAISNVNLDTHKSDAAAVIATLPTTVKVTLEENATDNLAIEWSCANFNTAPLSENTFTWTATNTKYDSNNVELTGTITVANPAANAVSITVKTENTTVVYNATDIDLTSLFDIDTNAGNATYTVTNGTGAGTQNGTALSVTKAGTFTVKVDTAANGIYAAGTQSATLTVEKANGTGTVSMEGWTYGETAKEPVISDNKGAATYQYKVKGSDDSTYSPDKPSNAGEYTVKATFAETDLYKETTATADFTIAKAQAVISVDTTPIVKTYGDTWELPTATTTFGAVSADKTVAEMSNAGEYTVTYTVAGNDNYNGDTKTVSVTINPKKIDKPSVDNTSFVYDGNEHTYNVATSDYYTITGNKMTNAGSQTVTVALKDKVNYTWNDGKTDDVIFTFTIAKKDITGATVGNFEEITYTGGVQIPFATVTIDGLIVTGTWSDVTNVADKTTFTANGNFTGTIADKETGMLKANSSVATVPGANALTYSEAAQELVTAGVANGGTLKYSLDNSTWVDAIPTGTNADTYEVWYKVFGDANHNDTDSVKVDVTIAKKSIEAATVVLDGTLTYTGAEQTQNVTVTLEGFTVTFDVTDNKATNVKADGNYTLKVTANGNFTGEKTLEWNIAKADHIIEGENIPTASRIRRGNKLSTSTITPAELKDADGNVLGTFTWVTPDDEMTETGDFVKQVKFTPTDTNNYNEKTFDVTVNVYRPSSSGGGSSSNTTTTTTKNEDGSTTKVTENKATGTKTEVTTNTDGSTTTVETKKDGTVTTTEKDKDGNTTTTVEKSDGTSTTTEKNKDGSEKVTEEKEDGTTVTTEKDTDGTKTVTTENVDGSKTTEETKKDGTKVTTETTADGETKTEIDLPKDKETEVTIPVDSAEDVTSVTVTDKDGKETEITDFEITEDGVKLTVSGDCTAVINQVAKKEFVDVHPVNHWATADIDYVYINGLMMGTSENHFSPDVPLTRAMLVTVLYRLEGEPEMKNAQWFEDVEKGLWYSDAVAWATFNGITMGYGNGNFGPDDNITREQIAAIMHRYAQYKGFDVTQGGMLVREYNDYEAISDYALSSMTWAVNAGLLKGKGNNNLAPQDNATRAEIAAILHRFIGANK